MQTSNPNDPMSSVASAVDDKRESIASGIDSAASALRAKAESLPGGERMSRVAHGSAEAMEKAAEYVRDQDLRGMLADVQQVIKRTPGVVLLTAVAFGFLVARSFSRTHTLTPD